MKINGPLNTLLLADTALNETGILKEIGKGSEQGLKYMHQLFHLELWYFAYGFMDEQEAFELALKVIQKQWEDRYDCESIEIMDNALYLVMVFYCLPYVHETADHVLQIKDVKLEESGLHDFMEGRIQDAREFVNLTMQRIQPASLN